MHSLASTTERKPEDVLHKLWSLQKKHKVSILKLAEPVSSAGDKGPDTPVIRTSDASNASIEGVTPTSLEADLIHYKELFAKLRFSYVEQVTKEKFIRSIVGDPPLIVTSHDNAQLEKENLEAKATLKALKIEVADMVAELEKRGRELTRKYESMQVETAQLEELPEKICSLEETTGKLRSALQPGENPNIALPLSRTLELVDERTGERDDLHRQVEQLQVQEPRKRKEMERLQAELAPLENKKQHSITAAKEARRRKEAVLGGVQDDLEVRGRWWRGSELALSRILDMHK